MKRFLYALFGWFRVTFSADYTEKALNYLHEKHLFSWDYSTADGVFCLSVGYGGKSALDSFFSERNIEFGCEFHGLPQHILALRSRLGLVFGALAAVAIFCMLGTLVWDIRIEGNSKLTDEAILEELAAAGLSVGDSLSDFDRRRVMLEVLENSDALSFVAVNTKGSVVHVKVMERAVGDTGEKPTGGANLIAARDAVIDSLFVRCGEVIVRAGQVVKEGELLVSGITDAHGGSRLLYAEGEVFGRVTESFTVTVPKKSEKRIPISEKTVGFSLIFFGKCINIFGGGGNLPASYGTIYYEKEFVLPGEVRLPFSFVRTALPEYRTETITLSEKELVASAMRLVNERLTEELADGELLSRSLHGNFTDEGYTLTCEYTCIRNIAKTVEFTVE